MASPNFDNLHLYLSRKMQDPVAAAGTDGGVFTSAERTDYLNRANKFIQLVVYEKGRDFVDRFLPGLVKTQAITWASVGTSLETDYSQHLSCQYTLTIPVLLRWVPPSRKIILDNDQNRNIDAAYTILASKIYGYYNYAQLTSGSGVLYYLSNDTRASNGDTNDISIDALWYDTLVDLAASFAHADRGNQQFSDMNAQRIKMVLAILGMA